MTWSKIGIVAMVTDTSALSSMHVLACTHSSGHLGMFDHIFNLGSIPSPIGVFQRLTSPAWSSI